MKKEKEYNIYNAYYYEMLGNKKNGFEVNNVYLKERDIHIEVDISDNDLKRLIKKVFELKKGIHLNSIEIEGEDIYTLYFTYLPDYIPIGELVNTKILNEGITGKDLNNG